MDKISTNTVTISNEGTGLVSLTTSATNSSSLELVSSPAMSTSPAVIFGILWRDIDTSWDDTDVTWASLTDLTSINNL